MSRDELDVVRQIYDGLTAAYSAAELPLELFDPEVELVQTGAMLDTAGAFHGHEGIRAARQELLDSFEKFRFDPEELYEAPDGRVVALVRVTARGRGSGVELDLKIGHVWTLRERKVVRWTVHVPALGAFEEAGLSAPRSVVAE